MKNLIYGPVPSRRLGRSLGVDMVPHKVCSYDCIYCQLGPTKERSIEPKAYIPAELILRQICERLEKGVDADHITLGGSGEPLLNTEIRTVIHEIKRVTGIPVAVLTNGSLLTDVAARRSLEEADVVIPSLDAHDQALFERINRPHPDIKFEAMVEGLVAFRNEYPGEVWLEVFVLEGINATESDAIAFRRWIERIDPHKVHVNTAVRPTAEPHARRVPPGQMALFCRGLGRKAEIIVPFEERGRHETATCVEQDLLDLLARRPCSLADMASGLNVSMEQISDHIENLLRNGAIETVRKGAVVYYLPTKRESGP